MAKNEVLQIRLSEEEKTRWEGIAEGQGKALNDYIRDMMNALTPKELLSAMIEEDRLHREQHGSPRPAKSVEVLREELVWEKRFQVSADVLDTESGQPPSGPLFLNRLARGWCREHARLGKGRGQPCKACKDQPMTSMATTPEAATA